MSRVYRFAIVVGVLIVLVVFTVLMMGTLDASQVNAQAECTLQTLNGTYLFEGKGVFMDGEGADATLIHYAEAGFQTYDGEGNFEGMYSSRVNGEFLDNMLSFTGTYELQPGCVFIHYVPIGDEIVEMQAFATRDGTFMTYVGQGASGTARKP